jgi:hypothetical protein
MAGLQYDLVGNPLGVVRATFERTATAAVVESGGADPVAAFHGKDWVPATSSAPSSSSKTVLAR